MSITVNILCSATKIIPIGLEAVVLQIYHQAFPLVPRLVGGDKDILEHMDLRRLNSKIIRNESKSIRRGCYLDTRALL